MTERVRRYGTNAPKEMMIKGVWELVREQLNDRVMRTLIFAALIALLLGICKEGLATVVLRV